MDINFIEKPIIIKLYCLELLNMLSWRSDDETLTNEDEK